MGLDVAKFDGISMAMKDGMVRWETGGDSTFHHSGSTENEHSRFDIVGSVHTDMRNLLPEAPDPDIVIIYNR